MIQIVPEIQLIDGSMFNFIEPDPAAVTVENIAAALSKQCRFAGHVKRFYSVAEHYVRGSYLCADPLAFLLHDASEAFVVDVPTPLKVLLSGYAETEGRVQDVIMEKFDVELSQACVKHTDLVMLATEKRDLTPPSPYAWAILDGIEPTDRFGNLACQSGRPETWERLYVERFQELTR